MALFLNVILISIIALGCKTPKSDPDARADNSGNKGVSGGTNDDVDAGNNQNDYNNSNYDEDDGGDNNSKTTKTVEKKKTKKPKSRTEDEEDVNIDLVETTEEIEYPKVYFKGTGKLIHRRGETDITQDIWAKVDKNRLTYQITYFAATGGANDGRVDDEIKNSIGPVIYARPSKTDRFFESNDDAKKGRAFLVFSRRAQVRSEKNSDKWRTVAWTNPVPAVLVPGPLSRYDVLKDGPLTYPSTVTSGNKTFEAIYTVSAGAKTASTIEIIIDVTIATDEGGELYEKLPGAKRLGITVDTNNKRIARLESLSYYDSEDKDERQPITLDFELCRLEFDDRTDTVQNCENRSRN